VSDTIRLRDEAAGKLIDVALCNGVLVVPPGARWTLIDDLHVASLLVKDGAHLTTDGYRIFLTGGVRLADLFTATGCRS